MTTAREQAREAARQAARHGNGHDDDVRAEEAADAASDVWEPLLKDLCDEIMAEITNGHLRDASTALWDAVTRAHAALYVPRPLPAAVTGQCSECGGRVYTPIDDQESRCAGCVAKEERKASSSGAVPKGFWDRTKKDDRGTND